MIRRQPLETKINHERWLISYADFITLLFAFFVVMYSVSQVNENKYKELSNTLQEAFTPSAASQNKKTTDKSIDTNATARDNRQAIGMLDTIQQEIETALQGLLTEGALTLNGNEQWIELAIDASALFESGKAQPSREAREVLVEVANVLAPFDNALAVGGHTDNVPITNNEFQNNWALSSARAVSVVNFLAFAGISPERLSAVGYGEHRPIAENESAQGRAKNRRVVLRIAKERAVLPQVTPSEAVLSNEQASDQSERGERLISVPEVDLEGNRNANEPPNEEPSPPVTVKPIDLGDGRLLFTRDPNPERLPNNSDR